MDTKRFEELKSRAVQILYILDTLTGDGSIIHERNGFYTLISCRLRRLEERGEEVKVYRGPTFYFTLDGLEQMLNEVNKWIAKVKGGNQ